MQCLVEVSCDLALGHQRLAFFQCGNVFTDRIQWDGIAIIKATGKAISEGRTRIESNSMCAYRCNYYKAILFLKADFHKCNNIFSFANGLGHAYQGSQDYFLLQSFLRYLFP